MSVKKLIIVLTGCLILTGIVLLGGCGGGGGSSAPPTTFKLTVDAAAVPTGTTLGAIEGTITVPAGLDIRTTATGQVQDGQITAAGTAATGSPQVIGNFNRYTRQLIFEVISPGVGFGNGPCAVITFDVTANAALTAADFTVISAEGKDYTSAAAVSGVAISLR